MKIAFVELGRFALTLIGCSIIVLLLSANHDPQPDKQEGYHGKDDETQTAVLEAFGPSPGMPAGPGLGIGPGVMSTHGSAIGQDIIDPADLKVEAAEGEIILDVTSPLSQIENMSMAIKSILKGGPKRDLYQNEDLRKQLAKVIVAMGEKYKIDPYLLLAMAFKEGSLRVDAVGKLGEVSTMQVHGVAQTRCINKGFSMTTLPGQIECGAFYLSTLIKDCGGLKRGLSAYASGHCDGGNGVMKIVNNRLGIAADLRHEVENDDHQ